MLTLQHVAAERPKRGKSSSSVNTREDCKQVKEGPNTALLVGSKAETYRKICYKHSQQIMLCSFPFIEILQNI